MKFSLYSKPTQISFRVLSLIASFILIISCIYRIYIHELYLLTLILNSISGGLLLLFFIFPTHIEILSLIAGLYCSVLLVEDPENRMSVIMFFICISTLYARGFFHKREKLKIFISLFIFITLWLSQIRFGMEKFISSSIQIIGYFFTIICILFFFLISLKNKRLLNENNSNDNSKILDLSKYPKLKKRDAEWLTEIQNKVKYDSIAIDSRITIGAVKNRLRFIYRILNVGDKTGFLNEYSDYTICYGNTNNTQHKTNKIKNTKMTLRK